MAARFADIEAPYRPTHDERARQSFVGMVRKHSIMDMKQDLETDFRDRVAPALERQGKAPDSWRGIERAMEERPAFRFYSSVRYNAQEMAYHSAQPPIERALPEMIETARTLAETNPSGGSLTLDPKLEIPAYVSTADVHLAPGCFHTEHVADDVAQGALVFLGGRVFGLANPFRRNEGAVGDSVGYWLTQAYPDFQPKRMLDIGTTSGRNLFPYATHFPGIELNGIDVGAPPLRFGHALAERDGVPVHFSQQNAEATNFPDASFDLIVSSFFFHEITLGATKRVLKECHRLLRPGGMIVHMELPPEGQASDYENFFWNWDTANNNEPGYTVYRSQDPVALCVEAGFPREGCVSQIIPDHATHGDAGVQAYVAGNSLPLSHGAGAWYIFGARKAG